MSYTEILERMAVEKEAAGKFAGIEETLKGLEKRMLDHYSRVLFARSQLRMFLRKRNGVKMLDVGVGNFPIGYGLPNIELYVAIDFYKPYLRQYCGESLIVVNASFDSIPFKSSFFDVALWFEGPEHSINPNHTLGEIKRVTKEAVFLSTPDGGEHKGWQVNWEHLHVFTYESLSNMLSQHFSRFEVIKVPPYWLFAACWV